MATESELRLLLRAISDDSGLRQMSTSVDRLRQNVDRTQTGNLGKGFDISAASALKFGGALAGVSGGLALLQTAAQAAFSAIGEGVEAQASSERTARAVAASYGGLSTQFTGFASALSAASGFTSQAILEAALSARTLSDNYGLSIAQTQKLIAVSADLAQIRGIGVAAAFERVQSAIRGEAEASEFLGLTLNATFLKNNAMNGSLKNTFETMTDAQKAQVVYAEVLRQSAKFSGLAAEAATGLDGAMTRANTSASNLSTTLGKLVEPAAIAAIQTQTTAVSALDQWLQQATKSQLGLMDALTHGTEPRMLLNPPAIPPPALPIRSLAEVPESVAKNLASVTQAAAGAIVPVAQLDKAFTLVNETLQRTHRDLAQVAADIGETQSRATQLSTILGALGPDDTAARAQVSALQDLQAIDARINAQRAAAAIALERQREQEATKITDPRDAAGARAAQQRLEVLDQLIPAEQARAEALKAQTDAARAQTDAQARVSALEVQGQQRQLAVAQPLADLRTETLLREVQIADVQQREADLADRITVASRQNLDLVRQAAQAKLDSLETDEALNDNQFESQQLKLENKAIRADVRRGVLDQSALDEIRPNRVRITELRREAPRLESDAFNAARPGELLQRQATREQAQQTITLSIFEEQKRVLDDQLTPLRQAQALTDVRTQTIQRQLELQTLGETAARTAAAQNLISANASVTAATQAAAAADLAVQKSIEFGANVGSTLQNVKQAWQELGAMPLPQFEIGPAAPPPSSVPPGGLVNPDRQRPGAGGAPSQTTPGGLPVGNTTTVTVNMTFTGPVNDPQAIAQEVVRQLDNAFDSAPRASQVGLAGAIG